jgi:Lhr-like helicase
MKHLIKKILNEFDENDFGWVEQIDNDFSNPQTIVSMVKSLLYNTDYESFIDSVNNEFIIRDRTGYYFSIELNELSFDRIKDELIDVIENKEQDKHIVDEYKRLYDILKPLFN